MLRKCMEVHNNIDSIADPSELQTSSDSSTDPPWSYLVLSILPFFFGCNKVRNRPETRTK